MMAALGHRTRSLPVVTWGAGRDGGGWGCSLATEPLPIVPTMCTILLLSTALAAPDWNVAGDEVTHLLSDYLRVDTTNPPGNETRGDAKTPRSMAWRMR